MKQLLLITLLLSLAVGHINAQGLTPSTVRQVFALEAGDSLEYHEQSDAPSPGCGTVCSAYRLNVIDATSYNSTQDTLIILFHSQILHSDTATYASTCGTCRAGFSVDDYFSLTSGRWVLSNLDSSIISFMDTVYRIAPHFSEDTIYNNVADFENSKQDKCYFGTPAMIDWQEVYADSLGLVYKTEVPGVSPMRTEQLTYYHKANGKTWGQRFLNVGINDVPAGADIRVYPNPATDILTIHCDNYTSASLDIYDLLSQKVKGASLTSKETIVTISGLPAGIYTWRLSDGINTIKTGKLIKD